jgi:hypothetical protein
MSFAKTDNDIVTEILNPLFLRELQERTAFMLRNIQTYDAFRHFIANPIDVFINAGLPSIENLPDEAKIFLSQSIKESKISFPEDGIRNPFEYERFLKCALCVIMITIGAVVALVALGITLVIGGILLAVIVPPLSVALATISSFISGISAAAIFNTISVLVVAGGVLLIIIVSVSLFICQNIINACGYH